ncbi:hypothetical protein H7J07_16985 [Mycobacterium koreense]|uniref:Transposase n=1 Tax=Mycolicibacillus koreensis TaxID=1069220 RepID=A0AA91PG94_9MYCO|nr:hypothetical protein [Mycolicibacillus koreensis]MCV7249897.1 hypothetical protein [Mycolicibacillus koreensis]OSC34883.1 hypothetical protein B8W67_05005 [Mycolicibacillus koreensis]
MAAPAAWVWLVSGYALILLAIAWGFDHMARRTSARAAEWRTGGFVYHPDHDAWVCPEDQWLWPTSFDPQNRVMRYRGTPSVCNSCPVKDACTTSERGREISREVDPWPYSETGRFHRGIACAVAGFGVLLPGATLTVNHNPSEILVLGTAITLVVLGALPLVRHLWNSPANAPEHLPHRTVLEDQVAAAIDRYSTQWGGAYAEKENSDQ